MSSDTGQDRPAGMKEREATKLEDYAGNSRAELLAELQAAGRVLSTVTVMFHTALAAKVELSATEEKALDLLERFGPLTAGELSRRSGLAPSSVTGLIDRLERKGFARRVPNTEDGRSVLIEVNRRQLDGMGHYFGTFLGLMDQLYAGYTDEQLATILHFVTETARRQSKATAELSAIDDAVGP